MGSIEVAYDNQPLVEWMLGDVELEAGFSLDQIGIAYNEQEKSLNVLACKANGGIALMGWLADGQVYDSPPEVLENITHLKDLSPDLRNLDIVEEGVGSRLYNTRSAALGALISDSRSGLYTVDIDPAAVLDARMPSEGRLAGKLLRIAQHAGKIAAVKVGWARLDEIVDKVNHGYGDAEAVIWGQPPRALLRQYERGGTDQVIPPTFAIIRAERELRMAGTRAKQ